MKVHSKALGLAELIAIGLGGMIGGGIFSILGISVEHIGNATPIAILAGGLLAFFAAHAYVKLAILYKDEGATYSFFKKSFPKLPYASSVIGWLIVFGYISTLALYAFTFAAYFCSQFENLNNPASHRLVSGLVILAFAILNIVSVKGMGKVEDWLVYTKVILILFISGLFLYKGDIHKASPLLANNYSIPGILIIASVTFVAYEGFQLIIHAFHESHLPVKNVPRAIYTAIIAATIIYTILAIASMSVIPRETMIEHKEYALAAGAQTYLGNSGYYIVIIGALLATASAISGTLFGASRLIAVISNDGYLPKILAHRIKVHIPVYAVIIMSIFALVLILTGGLRVILEFGSITFIIVSLLMSFTNFVVRKKTNSGGFFSIISIAGLFVAGVLIFYFEYTENPRQLIYILSIYLILTLGSLFYAWKYVHSKN